VVPCPTALRVELNWFGQRMLVGLARSAPQAMALFGRRVYQVGVGAQETGP